MFQLASQILFRGYQALASVALATVLLPVAYLMFSLSISLIRTSHDLSLPFLNSLMALVYAGGGLLLVGVFISMMGTVLRRKAFLNN